MELPIAAEENGSIILMERLEARVWGLTRGKGGIRFEIERGERFQQLSVGGPWLRAEVDVLHRRRDMRPDFAVVSSHLHRDDRHAEEPGDGDLGEYPLRLDRFRRGIEENDDTLPKGVVDLPLPRLSAGDALEVEEAAVSLLRQLLRKRKGRRPIGVRMTDEYAWHVKGCPELSTSLRERPTSGRNGHCRIRDRDRRH